MINYLMKLSQGNPGALTCLVEMVSNKPVAGVQIISFITQYEIFGTDLHVFWSDLCNKNYDKMVHLTRVCPPEILTDACSRQDYSGRGLVGEYWDTYEEVE